MPIRNGSRLTATAIARSVIHMSIATLPRRRRGLRARLRVKMDGI
jgi:hypothetical protein